MLGRSYNIRPFVSILIIIVTLFFLALSKVTLRRISYFLYKESKRFNKVEDQYYKDLKKYSKLNRPEILEKEATRRSLGKLRKGQIIQVIDGKAAISQ